MEVEFIDIDCTGQIVVDYHSSTVMTSVGYQVCVRQKVLKEGRHGIDHEASSAVLYDPTGTYQCGDSGIMIPEYNMRK